MPSAGVDEILPEVFEGDRLGAKYMNTLAALSMRANRFNRGGGMRTLSNGAGDFTVLDPETGIPIYNGDGTTIPAYGVVLRNGVQNIDAIKVKQPDTYGCQENFFVNSGDAVDGTDYGFAQEGFGNLFIAAYDSTDGTPAVGDLWGPRSGTYLLKVQTGGFVIEGIYDATNHYAWVRSSPWKRFTGFASADIPTSTAGTVAIWWRSGAFPYVNTGVSKTNLCINGLDATVKNGSRVEVVWDGQDNWKIVQADFSC